MTIKINEEQVGEVKGVSIVPKLPAEGIGYFVKVLGEIEVQKINVDKINLKKIVVSFVEE